MVEISPLPPLRRWVLRGDPALLPGFAAALGVTPPEAMLRATSAGPRALLWLGPDEWLLLAEAEADIAWPATGPVSLVDVSAGRAGCRLTGADAPLLLAEGCPLDAESLPPGACTRTLFGKVEVTLWRHAAAEWQLETARSFAPHLGAHLAEALADLAG